MAVKAAIAARLTADMLEVIRLLCGQLCVCVPVTRCANHSALATITPSIMDGFSPINPTRLALLMLGPATY